MDFTTFVRKPFSVNAIEITEDNIKDLAHLIGTIQTKKDDTVYIQVDRRLVPNVHRVYPGFWLTKMDANVRCYPAQIFRKLFVKSNADIEAWINYLDSDEVGAAGTAIGLAEMDATEAEYGLK